ncbi:hypothetical protein Cob_v008460 [Colletotrichum orbiculare MAFF 240422]|uniref:Myb-like domain-containing protein n=3 Tax=Colletotrichum orbiculare species complex TaxID=2707354 RepID=N4V4J7_COLOR|nr:hypothetical protein Cob_v008460 [Colletotrichum orbiculare MAFF 240422]TDZ37031.1 hypothetical protein C8035_v008173 [Colletotrichum spinosum]TDZ61668.1 hypothetical protein CTRI78_v004259 [Colletotrichum trifolii]
MCLHVKYICPSCRRPLSQQAEDYREACGLTLTYPDPQMLPQGYAEAHAQVEYHERIPLPMDIAERTNFTCPTVGCAYNPTTLLSDGNDPVFLTIVRCPGCDHIFTTESLKLDCNSIGVLQRFLAQNADLRPPILGRQWWRQYACSQVHNGCLWSNQLRSSTIERVAAIRNYLRGRPTLSSLVLPLPANGGIVPERWLLAHTGVRTPSDNPAPAGQIAATTRRAWTPEETQLLVSMKEAGFETRHIAISLGRSSQQVRAKWRYIQGYRRWGSQDNGGEYNGEGPSGSGNAA